MRHSYVRRLGAVAGGVVVAAGLAVIPVGSAAAVVPAAAADETAGWIADQLTDGLIFNDDFGFNDIGLSADAAFALDYLGGHDATVGEIATAIEPLAESEWYTSEFEGVTSEYAGSVAKALVLAQIADSDPTDFGGVDLVERLEDRVATTGAIAGRIEDVNNDFGDANVIGQSYAVEGLDTAESNLTDSATDFLLAQQCPAGYFRLSFSTKDAADQSCAVGDAPDTDATALALLALQGQADDFDVQPAIADARSWLLSTQKADGSFGGGTSTEGSNTNSTGLAAWALYQTGSDCAAARAAAWVLGFRVTDPAVGSPLADDEGAIAYDAAALTLGQTAGITATSRDQWRRATFQAAPALLTLLSEAPNARLAGPKGFVKAGTFVRLTLSGLAAGERICFFGPGFPARAVTGTGSAVSFSVPAGSATAKRSYAIQRQSSRSLTSFQVLGPKTLKVDVKRSRIAVGGKQVIKISKLAPRERFAIEVAGGSSGKGVGGVASANGTFTFRFSVGNKPGKFKVKAVGQFGTRKGSASFRVIR